MVHSREVSLILWFNSLMHTKNTQHLMECRQNVKIKMVPIYLMLRFKYFKFQISPDWKTKLRLKTYQKWGSSGFFQGESSRGKKRTFNQMRSPGKTAISTIWELLLLWQTALIMNVMTATIMGHKRTGGKIKSHSALCVSSMNSDSLWAHGAFKIII